MSDRFKVINGDSLAVLRDLPSKSVQAIITDPPYSSGGMFRGDRSKDTGAKYVRGGQETAEDQGRDDFHGDNKDVFIDWRQLPAMTDAIQCGGWVWRGIVPWNKTEATRPQKGWFRAQCEYLVVAAKGKPALYDATGKTDVPALAGFFVCPTERDMVHQTQKPVSLMRWIMGIIPKEGTVLDPFAGSGTTGVAALLEGRRFIGVELSEHYAAIATERCRAAAEQGVQVSMFEGADV
jgi:site-specific DNA-methyltransferase (adenine-specific)